jgi:hypothetical protein
LALINLAGLLVFIFDRRPIVQKLLTALIVLWLFVIAARLRSVAASSTVQKEPTPRLG